MTMLAECPLTRKDIAARIGGTTCIDYTSACGRKGDNVLRLARREGWRREDMLYIGDALYPGGNDESVIGVCDTLPVANCVKTLAIIHKFLCY